MLDAGALGEKNGSEREVRRVSLLSGFTCLSPIPRVPIGSSSSFLSSPSCGWLDCVGLEKERNKRKNFEGKHFFNLTPVWSERKRVVDFIFTGCISFFGRSLWTVQDSRVKLG
ncbi:hypothetical protein ILYODFUR_018116 [Ilyodon furcidens]|uniref:Uncharacterized protein n=1 Tax=Ilyodon furcidens TaxID=33524 RepID=A0ABV0T920_9TELE